MKISARILLTVLPVVLFYLSGCSQPSQAHPASMNEIHFISEQVGFGGKQITQDGGKTWSLLPTPPNMLGDPYFVDSSTGWALTSDSSNFQIQRTTDGGKTWTNFAGEWPGVDGYLSFVDAQHGWLAIQDSPASVLYETTDGGKTWQQKFVFGSSDEIK